MTMNTIIGRQIGVSRFVFSATSVVKVGWIVAGTCFEPLFCGTPPFEQIDYEAAGGPELPYAHR